MIGTRTTCCENNQSQAQLGEYYQKQGFIQYVPLAARARPPGPASPRRRAGSLVFWGLSCLWLMPLNIMSLILTLYTVFYRIHAPTQIDACPKIFGSRT